MCTGRVDLSFPLRAFLNGADGVFVGGCWPGECHYITEGNYDAMGNMMLCRKLMEHVGLNPKRLRLEWVAASEGSRFAEVMDDFGTQLKELGPLGQAEGLDPVEMKAGLETVYQMVPQAKLLVREKLGVRKKSEAAYEKLYASKKTEKLIAAFLADPASTSEELPAYYIEPEKCVGCELCLKKCPIQAIDGSLKVIHEIDQEDCTHCGTCYYACPPKIGAVRKVIDGVIPDGIPAADRVLAKGEGKKKRARVEGG